MQLPCDISWTLESTVHIGGDHTKKTDRRTQVHKIIKQLLNIDGPIPMIIENYKPVLPAPWHVSYASVPAWIIVAVAPYPLGVDLVDERQVTPQMCAALNSPTPHLFAQTWTRLEAERKLSGKGLDDNFALADLPGCTLTHLQKHLVASFAWL